MSGIPISAAKKIADTYGQKQVILVTWQGDGVTHVVTYGDTLLDCEQAAVGGNLIKRTLGWPEDLCNEKSTRVLQLEERIVRLENSLKSVLQENAELTATIRELHGSEI